MMRDRMTGMKMAPSRSETMAEMQSSPPAAFSPSLSSPSSARARPAPVLLPSPASKLIQSCSMPRRPPAPLVLFRVMSGAAGAGSREHELNSTYLFARRAPLAPSSDVVAPQPTAAAAATYHKEVVGLPLSLSPSSLRLSVCRSFLRGNWMTQKASQVSERAERCGDATRRRRGKKERGRVLVPI